MPEQSDQPARTVPPPKLLESPLDGTIGLQSLGGGVRDP